MSPAISDAPGRLPVALLPVRLETRYQPRDGGGWTLQVRVYHDDLHVDTHEPELTRAERTGGAALWAAVNAERITAWRALVALSGQARAGYVAAATAPGHPDPGTRDAAWTRPALVRALPDRWVALGYRDGQRVFTVVGANIDQPLAAGPTPGTAGSIPAAGHVDEGMAWLVDFDRAVTAGMGMEIELAAGEEALERLIVLGVRGAVDGAAGAAELAQLLGAHLHSHGLALLPQGTATNAEQPAVPAAPDPEKGLTVATGEALCATGDGRDGTRLAELLGVAADVFAHTEGAGGREALDPQAANAGLWATGWGHLLGSLLTPDVPATSAEAIRRHFIDYVRARGPAPIFRIGRQPYGVLPVLAPKRATMPDDPEALRALADILARLTEPFVHAGSQQLGRSVADALARTPTSISERVRAAYVPVDTSGWFQAATRFMGRPREQVRQERDAVLDGQIADLSRLLGRTAALRWLRRGILVPAAAAGEGYPATRIPRVAPGSGAQLAWLANASAAELAADGAARPGADALLYLLVRSALLRTLAAAGASGPPTSPPPFVPRGRVDGQPDPAPPSELEETYAAVGALAMLGDAPLERLLGESLDLTTSRWDAWVTSLATRRLATVRAAGPSGTLVGGYAWVEGLAPDPPGTVVPVPFEPDAPPARVDPDSGGYVAAPGVAQAVTAAVLRCGQLTHRRPDGGPGPLAVDLSSRRVRLAQSLVAGVHQGTPLGVLLGYRLERALQEAYASAYIAPLRELAPLDLPPESQDGRSAAAAATDVVDGLALARRRHGTGGIPWGTRVNRYELGPSTPVVEGALDELDEAIDAVSDALLAEGVHQTIQGSPARAAASGSSPVRGEAPPSELEFVRTQSRGLAITHRILELVGDGVSGWAVTPRAESDPGLASWAGALLGDPGRIVAALAVVDASSGEPLEDVRPVSARLDALGLNALDVLAVARRPLELERYLEWRLLHRAAPPPGVPAGAALRLLPAARHQIAVDRRALPDVLALALAATKLLEAARPLDARDFAPPGATDPGVDLDELAGRVRAARERLELLAAQLQAAAGVDDVAAASLALERAWLTGIAASVPAAPTGTLGDQAHVAALRRQIAAALVEIERRLAPDPAGAGSGGDAGGRLGEALRTLQRLLGDRHLPMISFALADPTLPRAAVDQTIVAGAPPGQDPATWLARITRVRPAVGALADVVACRELLWGEAAPQPVVGQLPLTAGSMQWIGLPLGGTPPSAAASLLFTRGKPADPPTRATLAGLVVDEWSEAIPVPAQTAALSFHYDAPGAQPPQAILVVAPPAPEPATWTLEDLEAAVLHVRDLAVARLADPASPALAALRPFLPAVEVTGAGGDPRAGIPATRLFTPPPNFGAVDLSGGPVISAVAGTLRQNSTATLTVTGSALDAARYSIIGGGLGLTASQQGPTGARLAVVVPGAAPPGPRRLQAATALGVAHYPLTVTAEPRLLSITPRLISQELEDVVVRLTVGGQGLAAPSNPRLRTTDGQSAGVRTAIEPGASATAFDVTLRVTGTGPWVSGWDPSEPGSPLKPPKKPPLKRGSVPLVLVVTVAGTDLDSAGIQPGLVLSTLYWAE